MGEGLNTLKMEHLLTDIFDIFCSSVTDSDAYEDKQMICINDLLLEDNQGFWLVLF